MRKSLVAAAFVASTVVLASCAMPADDPNFNVEAMDEGIEPGLAEENAADQVAMEDAFLPPTSLGIDTPLTAPPASGASLVSLTDGTEYQGVFESSLVEAAEVLGWTVDTLTVDTADPVAVETAFAEALAKAPSGIHITGTMVDSLSEGLASAEAAGIPVVCTGCSTSAAIPGITDSSINGTDQNLEWADVLASYVVASQFEGEDAGVQIIALPGTGYAEFNSQFANTLLDQCRNCSSSETFLDPFMVDVADSASVASFIASEMSMALGSWALLDSGAISDTVADTLATDPTLLSPVTVIGRGASSADIQALIALDGAAPADAGAEGDPGEMTTEGDAVAEADGDFTELGGRTPEEAAALQAWVGISQPIMAWRVVDQFARILGGEATVVGPIPSQFLTATNVAEAVLDASGNYLGVADYKEQFAALWGIQ